MNELAELRRQLEAFDRFTAKCRRRLVEGFERYGSEGYRKTRRQLLADAEEELMDSFNYAAMAWTIPPEGGPNE